MKSHTLPPQRGGGKKNETEEKMNQNNDPNAQQINIELGEKEAEGIYSNLAIITHSPC